MYYVYLLRLKDKSIYTGSTPDLKKRVKQHESGYVESTKLHRPLKLVWYCCFLDRLTALRFEHYLKTGSGQSFRNRHFL